MNVTGVLRKSNNWQDFKIQLQGLPDRQKGDCFEALTKYFLQLQPKYATLLSNVWLLNEVPRKAYSHLNLPGPDEGIDLIAETKDGEYWAIQCKYREDETTSLTRKELSTFTSLAFAICKNIELGLVCTTADRFSHKLTLYGERLSFCAGDVWRALDAEFFRQLHRLLDGKTSALMPYRPRDHQERAVRNAYTHFVEGGNSRGKLIMPCGTGKSLTAYWIAEKLMARTILVAVPSLALIRQTLEVWTRETVAHKRDVRWIAVCSDESVGEIERDDIAVLTQDLGVRVHTDPDEVAQWLRARRDSTTVVFTTYQSGRATAEAARKARTVFEVGIMDEAHKTVGKKNSLFSHLLSDNNIAIKKRIFMTATERCYRGQSDDIASMDDPELYGDTFELLSFKKALESQPPILSDYQIVTISVTREEIATLIQRNLFVRPDRGRWDSDVEAEMLAGLIALRKAMQKHPIRHAVSFHGSVARAKVFQQSQDSFSVAFSDFRKLESFHVSGKTPTAVRSREMDAFAAANRGLVTNARCLTEGVDVPNIDCVLFADPKRSTIDIVQAVGRALRPAEGKQLGYVVVPVLLDSHVLDSEINRRTAFDAVLIVLRALAANDERIVEYFRTVSQGRRWTGGRIPFSVDIPDGLEVDADDFVKSVELQLWSRLAKLSWRPFEEARSFVHHLKLKSRSEWQDYCHRKLPEKEVPPEDIPAYPNHVYEDLGWIGWGDWLGTGVVAPRLREFRPFEQARAFVHSLKLRNQSEWNKYCHGKLSEKGTLPPDIPAAPERTYDGEGWIGLGDWLGTGVVAPRFRKYRQFEQARDFVRGLKLKGDSDWRRYCRGKLPNKGTLPKDIPADPNHVYRDNGWASMGDWLGTGVVATRLREYRPFEEARDFVRSLGLKNQSEWSKYCQGKLHHKGALPPDISSNPQRTYAGRGWVGFGDWLGTGNIGPGLRSYRPFEESRNFVRCLGLKSQSEWNKYCQSKLPHKGNLPQDIPTDPRRVYKDQGWIGLGDWLGTGNVGPGRRKYYPFDNARDFVHSLGLKSSSEWREYCQGKLPEKETLPHGISSAPQRTYAKEGWISWGDWLGTGLVASRFRKFRRFENAREFVRRLNLKSQSEWLKYCQGKLPHKGALPEDIPSNPNQAYRDQGWISMGDWLGTGVVASQLRRYRPFEEARDFVHSLGLKSRSEWSKYCQGKLRKKGTLPPDIPASPERTYADQGWIGVGDWLGTGVLATRFRKYMPFEDARNFVRRLGLKSYSEWREYCQGKLPQKGTLPRDVPSDPRQVYKKQGWIGYEDWFGR